MVSELSTVLQDVGCAVTASNIHHLVSGTDWLTFGTDTLFTSRVWHRGSTAFLETVTRWSPEQSL
jgi:hypothetical protein